MRWWRTHDLIFGALLVSLSISLYLTQLNLFHDPRSTGFYLLQDLAFLPISILFVTLVLERLLALRDRRQRLEKLRMLIGTFFSWAGYHLLDRLARLDAHLPALAPGLRARTDWTEEDFRRVRTGVLAHDFRLIVTVEALAELHLFLHERAEFMIRLLENPMLLEHETFTELLRAIFHLIEELEFRPSLEHLPESDLAHLTGDCNRIMRLLVIEWIDHLEYLNRNYPYLYSLAVRMNPFMPDADPIVR